MSVHQYSGHSAMMGGGRWVGQVGQVGEAGQVGQAGQVGSLTPTWDSTYTAASLGLIATCFLWVLQGREVEVQGGVGVQGEVGLLEEEEQGNRTVMEGAAEEEVALPYSLLLLATLQLLLHLAFTRLLLGSVLPVTRAVLRGSVEMHSWKSLI